MSHLNTDGLEEAGTTTNEEYDKLEARNRRDRYDELAQQTQGRDAPQAQDPNGIRTNIATASTARGTTVAPAAQAAPVSVAPAVSSTAASVNAVQSDQQRAYQEALQQHLQGVAAGTEGPSAAQLQQAQGNRAAMSSQLAMVGGNKGYSGASQRQAMRNVAALQQQNNAQTSVLAAQEQAQARGELANLTGQIRQQDIGVATTNAGLQQQARQEYAGAQNRMVELQAQIRQQGGQFNASQANEVQKLQAQLDAQRAQANATQMTDVSKFNAGQYNDASRVEGDLQVRTNLANLDAQLKARGMDDEQRRAYLQAAMQSQGQVINADTEKWKTQYGGDLHERDLVGGFTAGAGALGAMSDRRAKTDVHRESDKDAGDFLSALESFSYRYKDPANGEGQRSGPMAQDLERSKIGRELVHTGPDGMKRVDTDGLVLAMAGVLGRLAKEGRLARGAT